MLETVRGRAARLPRLSAPLVVAAICFVAATTRQSGTPRYRTIWAEDGQIFGQCALTSPSPLDCLGTPYDGYFHTIPRLAAWLATAMPMQWLSYSMTVLAAAILAACGFLVARAVAEATRSLIAGITAGAALGLVYSAGAEVAGNLTNVHWILFTASMAVLACCVLGRALGPADIALVFATTASSAFGLLLIGLLLVAWMLNRGRPDAIRSWVVIVAAALVVVQVGAEVVAPRKPSPLPPTTPLQSIEWFVELVYGTGPFFGRGLLPGWVVGVATTSVLGALAWRASRRQRLEAPGGAEGWRQPLAMALMGISATLVFGASTFLNAHVTQRYSYVPSAGLAIALAVGVASLVPPTALAGRDGRTVSVRTLATAAVAIVLAIGAASTYRVRTGASAGPVYPTEFTNASQTCAAGAATAVIALSPLPGDGTPATWHIAIPCSRVGR